MRDFNSFGDADRRNVWLIITSSLIVTCGFVSIYLGTDGSWDLRNYHLYNAFAALNNRYLIDVAPAQLQSYFNPLLDFPFYFAIRNFNDWPRLIAFCMGAVHGINVTLVTLITWYCLGTFSGMHRFLRYGLTFVSVAIGSTGANSISLLGTTTGDVPATIPIFAALYYVLRDMDKVTTADGTGALSVLVAGVLAGLAVVAKLPMGIYSIALAVALVATLPRRFLLLRLFGFVAGNIFGFLIGGGYHLFRMWRLFGNPVFPLMNNFFQSPFWENVFIKDRRFLPKSISEFLFYPFEWATYTGGGVASELAFRDIRIAVVITLATVVLVLWGARSFTVKAKLVIAPSVKALIVFGITAYVVWLIEFSIYRYLLPLEMLTGLYLVLGICALTSTRAWAVLSFVFLAACIFTTKPPDWGRSSFIDKYIQITAPTLSPNTLVAIVGTAPVSYIIPFISGDTVWISLSSNFLSPALNNLLVRRERELMATHEGPVMVLGGSDQNETKRILAAFDFKVGESHCDVVSSNITSESFQLCPAYKIIKAQRPLSYAQVDRLDPHVFDVNADWTHIDSTNVLVGSYPVERSDGRNFVWVGPDSSIKFWPTHKVTQVHIKGYVPFSQHARQNGVTKLVVEVKSAGHKLGSMEFDQDSVFERSFDLGSTALTDDGAVSIELHSSSSLLNSNVDKRDLGFIISWISIE